jgi:hypothetical protein
MSKLEHEIPTDEELYRYLMENTGLLNAGYASEYPGCEYFCYKATESIFASLRRLNRLPRSDPFWTNSNRRPTLPKLNDFCRLNFENNPKDTLALWTMAALEVAGGADGFGSPFWYALHGLGEFDVAWPICAALLQGGRCGISDRALASLLISIDAVEAAQPLLQRYAGSPSSHISDWAKRVLNWLAQAPADHCGSNVLAGKCATAATDIIARRGEGVSALSGYEITVYNRRTNVEIERFHDYGGEHSCFTVAADGSGFAYLTNDVRHWINPARISVRRFAGATIEVWTDLYQNSIMACTPDLTRAVITQPGRLASWDLVTGCRLQELTGPDEFVQVGISDDGHLAVSGSKEGWLILWDLEDGRCLASASLATPIQIGHDRIAIDGLRVSVIDRHDACRVFDFSECVRSAK